MENINTHLKIKINVGNKSFLGYHGTPLVEMINYHKSIDKKSQQPRDQVHE